MDMHLIKGNISDRMKDIVADEEQSALFLEFSMASQDHKKFYRFSKKPNGRLKITYEPRIEEKLKMLRDQKRIL